MVVGDPIAHSLSPAMHNAAIASLGLDAVYKPVRATRESFPSVVREVLGAGGALNVTVPFKRDAAELLATASAEVKRTGACNTIWGDPERPEGDNTDIAGVREAARALLVGRRLERALLLGTGGSARAAAVAVGDEWPGAVIMVVSRDKVRAAEFVAWGRKRGVAVGVWGMGVEAVDLVINATPLGLEPGDPLPVERGVVERVGAVLDLVYARGETALVREARRLGARAADGRGVLVAQGAAAFQRFFGVKAPISVMRQAVEDALRG